MADIIYSIHTESFNKWVKERDKARNEARKKKNNDEIELEDEVAAILEKTTHPSRKFLITSYIFTAHKI